MCLLKLYAANKLGGSSSPRDCTSSPCDCDCHLDRRGWRVPCTVGGGRIKCFPVSPRGNMPRKSGRVQSVRNDTCGLQQ